MATPRTSKYLKRCVFALIILTITKFLMKERGENQAITKIETNKPHNLLTTIHTNARESDSGGLDAKSGGKDSDSDGQDSDSGINNTAFHEILRQRALENSIIVSSVDSGYVDMAINLYFTSLKRFNIENYLFVGSDSEVCGALSMYDIACYEYIHDKNAKTASSYFSQAFRRKTHLKTKIILEALKIGLDVLITDVDIVFLKDPLEYFDCYMCDMEISSDQGNGSVINSGFYFVRSTPGSIKLHAEGWKQGMASQKLSNQKVINRIMHDMMKKKTLMVKALDPNVFPNGQVFFEKGLRMFKDDKPCDFCVIVHNNWIATSAAKIYRFKEHGMWLNDKNEYYSDEGKKYLSFGLPRNVDSGISRAAETRALKNALIIGTVLNRIVILPKFHCYGCKNNICSKTGTKCTLNTLFKVEFFDAYFNDRYRESVFLTHPQIPKVIRDSISPLYSLIDRQNGTNTEQLLAGTENSTPSGSYGATVDELMKRFDNSSYAVLRFHSLYEGLNYNTKHPKLKEVLLNLEKAFKKSEYRQIN